MWTQRQNEHRTPRVCSANDGAQSMIKQKSGQALTLTRYARLTARSGTDNQIASCGYHGAIILHGKSINVTQYVTLNAAHSFCEILSQPVDTTQMMMYISQEDGSPIQEGVKDARRKEKSV